MRRELIGKFISILMAFFMIIFWWRHISKLFDTQYTINAFMMVMFRPDGK